MATRLTSTFYSLNSEVYTVNVDDTSYVGTAVEVETASNGFSMRIESGETLAGIYGSKVNIPFVVNDDTTADIESFGADLITAPEGRFTVKITYKSTPVSSAALHWVGYVLPDLSGYEDSEVYAFVVSATDGIGRLKGQEYKDTGDVPFDRMTALEHILECLNKDGLAAAYYTASTDVFLRTVVNWNDDAIGAPSAAVCPLTRMRYTGDAFAKPEGLDDGEGWDFMTYYDVLYQHCVHFNARLIYSGGCYRFEQLNERANDLFMERRFSRNGTLVSSSGSTGYDKTVDQTTDGYKLATNVYNYLPALKNVKVTYDHNTYRNYLAGITGKWGNTSTSNTPKTFLYVPTDSDTIVKISGRCSFHASVTSYTKPWRWEFGMTLLAIGAGKYAVRSAVSAVDGSGNGTNIITFTPQKPKWTSFSTYCELSTDFIFGSETYYYFDFVLYTNYVPADTTGLEINFEPLSAWDNQDVVISAATLHEWQFSNLLMQVIGTDSAANNELIREYSLDNPVDGNSEVMEVQELFGHAVQPWTIPKIQTSSNGSTWTDTNATWAVGSGSTSYEFGQLLAAEIMSARQTPVKTINGEIAGTSIYAHSRIVTPDTLGWILRSGEFNAGRCTWSAEWISAGVDRITSTVIKKKIAIPGNTTTDGPPDPGSVPQSFTAGSQPGGLGKGVIALSAVTVNHTSAILTAGAITSIPLAFAVSENAYLAGDDIFVVNPETNDITGFTVSATAAAGATSLSVTSVTTKVDYPIGSHVVYSALNKYTGEGGGGTNLPKGTDAGQILRWNNSTFIWEVYSGSTDGHVLTWDTANGWQAEAAGGGGVTITAVNNGLNLDGTTIQLGGALVEDTLISGSFDLNFTPTKFIVGTTSTSSSASVNFHKANPSGATLASVIAHMSASGTDNNAKVSLGIGDVYNSGIGHFFNGGSGLTRLYNMTSTQQIRFAIGGETSDKVTIIGNNIGRLGAGFAGSTNLVSTLQSAGSFGANVTTHSGALTIGEDHFVMLYVGSTTVTWTMPSAAAATKRMYVVGNMSANSTINLSIAISYKNGQQFSQIFQNEWVCFWSTGAAWYGFKLVSL